LGRCCLRCRRGGGRSRRLFTVPEGWRAVEARVDGVRRGLRLVAPGVVGLGLTLEGRTEVEVTFER